MTSSNRRTPFPLTWAGALATGAVMAVSGGLVHTPAAFAGAVEPTQVTIKAEGTDIFGFVKSPDAANCADERLINVFKVTRDGNRKIGSDTASLNGSRYQWSIGNPGMEGRFFARAPKIPGCAGDRSETIRVQREDRR